MFILEAGVAFGVWSKGFRFRAHGLEFRIHDYGLRV
jgi:hypothetical protein